MTANMAASVQQRLLNIARADRKRFSDVFQHYVLERWLYRLSRSKHADRFILKGALMLLVWKVPVSRPTRDIDLLAHADNNLDKIKTMVADICGAAVDDDGLIFDESSIKTERIAEDALYEGVRATFQGKLGKARAAMHIDIGFSDVVTAGPITVDYPTLLDMPAPHLRAYNQETAIAEKFETMIKLGELNSRMKDFFDVWTLAAHHAFNGDVLTEAVARTFERRRTPLKNNPVCFSRDFARSEPRQAQWRAFIKRSDLHSQVPAGFETVWELVVTFLQPLTGAEAVYMEWNPEGHWTQR